MKTSSHATTNTFCQTNNFFYQFLYADCFAHRELMG